MIQMNDNQFMQQFPVSSADGVPMNPVNLPLSTRNKHMAEFQSMVGTVGSQQLLTGNMQAGPIRMMPTNQVQQKQSLSNKRKMSADGTTSKKRAQAGSLSTSPRLSHPSGLSKITAQQGSVSSSFKTGSSGKKVVQIEPATSKSMPSATKHKMNGVSPKPQVESNDSVRSKFRESLAAALSLVSQQQEDSSAVGKKSPSDPAINGKEIGDPKASDLVSSMANSVIPESGNATEVLPVSVSCPDTNHSHDSSGDVPSKDTIGEATNSWEFVGHDYQSDAVLHVEDPAFNDSFFIKDDLLLGNGLSWAMDFDGVDQVKPEQDPKSKHDDVGVGLEEQTVVPMETTSAKLEPPEESKVMHEGDDSGEKARVGPSAESVAFVIESELFKLFGGVNKKYKEKGRSLLFNLKDRNNPELRERVMSGEIPPDKLCSMTAEELASEELSQWRIAKAEELAQMKVLPDVEVDIRRLVKKTHKGEFQVEFEHDIASSLDVPGSSSFGSRSPTSTPKPVSLDNLRGANSKKVVTSENHSGDQDDDYRLTIPADGADGADMMQGLMEDDTRDLPPICSLDEFMESLDKEPPFEDLPISSGETTSVMEKSSLETSVMEKTNVEIGSGTKLVEKALKHHEEMKVAKTEEVKSKSSKVDADMKPVSGHREQKYPTTSVAKAEYIWDGLLQLNISLVANVVGTYKSGEKAVTKDWLHLFEVKGRVKLDAFEKFLQALPMSRTRTIMVAHFALKDGSTDSDFANLQEMVDSYIMESRVGFAEPASGVELYLCPPHKGTLDMLNKHLSKSYTKELDSIENGFIGIVVWRKAQLTSAISPKPETAIRHQPFSSSRRPQDKVSNASINVTSKPKPVPAQFKSNPVSVDDDDVPPGFGPSAAREDDDLPEFSFSGGSHRSGAQLPLENPSGVRGAQPQPSRVPPKRVDEMRDLIKKYGQGGKTVASGIVLEPWNDDDDDIPEWQPEAPKQWLPPPPPPQQTYPSPAQHHHIANPQSLQPPMMPLAKPMQPFQPIQPPFQPLQPSMSMQQNVAQWQQGARWTPGSVQPSNLGNQLGGQPGWERDSRRS